MHHGDDFDPVPADAVDENIVWVDDGFARSLDAARPIEERSLPQSFGAGFDCHLQAFRRSRIALGDIGNDRLKIVERARPPDQAQQGLLRALAFMIARTRFIASSCATLGRPSARDAAIFAFSQSR